MDKFLEVFKKLLEKFKNLSKGVKIASIISAITLIIAISSLFFYQSSNKYSVLFSGLDSADSKTVLSALEEQGVDFKVEGDSILVNKSVVDKLRLQLASNLTMGSTGYELMDSGSSFGMTEEEFQIKKLRMQQGELEKTIKSFEQISDARVHITLPTNSVFADEKEPGSAAVYVKLVAGKTLSQEQVKSIVALVSGSTAISKDNIQVMDSNMNLLSEDSSFKLDENSDQNVTSTSIATQLELEKKYEAQLQKSILELLTPVLGNGKVKVMVSADLDFDSTKVTETVVDPNKVIISQKTSKSENNSSEGNDNASGSGSVIDENMGNTIVTNDKNTKSTTEEQTTNYEVGKTETIKIKAPGEVKSLSASVIVDGEINDALRTAIEQSVSAAVGLNTERGDTVSVAGITFNTKDTGNITDPFAEPEANNNNMIYMIIAGVVGAILLIVFIVLRSKKKKANKELVTEEEGNLLDIVIEDKISKVEEEELKPIEFEVPNQNIHIENEIKKYAAEKPQQVADIVKTWLVESER